MNTTHTLGGRLLRAALAFVALALPATLSAQMAAGKSKFVGNIVASSVPSNFSTYWNQITPENSGKWGSVEATRDVMNWSQLDTAYNYAQSRGYQFKGHTLVWGAQAPGWITSLSQADQRAEIEEWIAAYAQRYPNTWAIDVVNEPVKTAIAFKNALGGNGSTGWDWVITAFQIARQRMPNTKLLINEYGTENDANARNQYLTIINLLKARGLIDGIGVQAHYFNLDNMSASQMTTCLNAYAATGLDVYISELDITGGGSDSGQLAKYQELFPVMWNHASVKGITLWGYIVGQTWANGTGIVNSNGSERPAMTWLKGYVSGGGGGGGGGGGTTPGNGTFKIVARHSGKAIDAGGTGDGAAIQQYSYWGGNNQRWTLQNRGNNQYSIIGVQSGKGLDVAGAATANGTAVQLYSYWGGNNQKFTFSSVGSGFYRITPVHATGGCLDVNGVSTADGARIHLWTYGGGQNQQWAFSAP